MSQQTPLKRVLFSRTLALAAVGVLSVISILAGSFTLRPQRVLAANATNNTINFQARLQTNTGAIVPDGYYNVQFKLYDGDTLGGPAGKGAGFAGTNLWTETWYDSNGGSAGNDNRVRVTNGYLTVSLGSLTAFPGTINWDQGLWLTMNIGGTLQTATPSWDGEMNPRLQLTAVPYALRAGQLAQFNAATGYTSTLSILQPTGGNQVFQLADQGTSGTYTICVQNSSACGFAKADGTTSTYIQNRNTSQQGSSNFWISGTGRADTALQAPSFDTPTAAALNIGTTNATSVTLGKSGVNTFVGGNLSVGTTQSLGAITIANGAWITGVDSTGSGSVNMFSVNGNNQIQVGAALNVDGGIVLPTDSGPVTLVDEAFSGGITAGTPNSYTLGIGQSNALTVYGENDGSGNAQNVRVGIGSSITPGYTLDVGGDINLSGGLYSGGSQVLTSGKVLQGVTADASILTGTIDPARISGSYTGISGVGTLTVGTWNASTIGAAYGGTGLNTVTSHGIVYGNGTSALGVTAAGTSGQILQANASGIPGFVTMSGDVTIAAGGATSIGTSKVTSTMILDGTIANGDLANNAVNSAKIADGTVTGTDIANNTITNSDVASGAFSNITGTGALSSGSIASGFGTISTGNNITTTATVQGGTVNATTALQTGGTTRIDASGNLTNIGSFSGSGNITTTAGVLSIQGTGNNYFAGNVGIGTSSPLAALDVRGGFTATGFSASNPGNTFTNEWTRLGQCTISTEYHSCEAQIHLQSTNNGGTGTFAIADIDWRVKQQAGLGGAPIVELYMSNSNYITKNDVVAVVTQNDASATVVELYLRPTANSLSYEFNPTMAASTNGTELAWFSNDGFTASLPTGTQIVSSYKDANFVDGTFEGDLSVGGQTVITSGQILQNVTADASILTSGTIASSLLTGPYTGITGVGTLTVGTWNASTIAVSYGGTGLQTVTSHGLLFGNGTGALGVTAAGTSSQVLVANASGVPTFVTFTGDVTVSASGTTAIGTSKVTSAMILDGTVANGDLANNAVNSAKIADGTVTGTDIADNTITNNNVASGDFGNITGTGALNSGSIASGFGTISTGNDITSTATVQGGTVNATGSLQTAGTDRIDSSGNLVNINNAAIGGVVTVTDFNSIKASLPANTVVAQDPTSLAQSPIAGSEWHDLLAFDKYATPTFEQYNGSAWNAAALDSGVFAHQENRRTTIVDGSATTAARWTWFSNSFSYSSASWLNIGFDYNNPNATKTIQFESSADGTTWTTRHTSTVSTNAAPAWFYVSSYGGDPYLRLTITSTNGAAIGVNSVRLMTSRWGDQGGGSESSYPYTWDGSQNITTGAALTTNGNLTVANNGNLTVGGQQVITSGKVLQGVTANASILTSGTIASGLLSGSYTGITGVGTITAGTWNGTAISDTYVADDLTVSTAGNVAWTALSAYPTGCGAGQAVTAIGDTLTCSTFATTDTNTTYSAGNDLDLTGTTFSIEPQLDTVTTISRASSNLTLQTTTSGNIILNSAGTIELQDNTNITGALGVTGSISTSTGDIQIGTTSVITSTKVLQNVTTDASIINNGTGTLNVNRGGTGATSFTAGGLLLGNGTGAITATGVLSNGQLLIGDGTGAPTAATLSGGSGISITNGAGSISIAVDSTVCRTTNNCSAVGTAGGDLSGSYPNPTIAKLQGSTLTITTPVGGNVLLYNGTAWVNKAVSGDITIDSTGATSIGTGKVTSTMILDGTIANGDLANNAVNSAKIADGTVTGTDIANNTITNSDVASGAFSNITGTGALDSGSITSNFGAINNGASGITTTGALSGGTLSVGGTQRIDASGNLVNIGNVTASGNVQQTGSSATNYFLGALGLGTANPQTGGALTVANNSWISSVDSAGTGYVNMFQVNAANQIQVGAALNVDGGIVLPTNGGQLTFADMGVDSNALNNTPESYSFRVGSTNALTVYGESDGTGNTKNVRVAIGSSITPGYTLDVGGDINLSGGLYSGGSQIVTSGKVLQGVTANASILTSGTIGSSLVSGSYTGITGVGTLTVGTWNASTVGVAYGGTGLQTVTSHGLVYGNGTGNLGVTAAGTSGQVLIANGSGIPTFATFSGDISTVSATGQITIANSAVTSAKILDGTIANGDLSNAAFGNIIGTGALASGSIVSGFGSISTGNNITTTATLQGGTVIATSAIQGPSLDTAAAGTLSIGTVHATTVNIATNAATHTIAIANGAAAQTVTIGSTNGSSSLTLQAGTSGIALNATNVSMSVGNGGVNVTSSNNSSTAFVVQSSTGVFLTADASTQTVTAKNLVVGSPANVSLATRLFSDGFESGDLTTWDMQSATGLSNDATVSHAGKYSLKMVSSASAVQAGVTIANSATVYGRTYFNVSTLGNPTYLEQFGVNQFATYLYVYLGTSGDLCYTTNLSGATDGVCSSTAPSTGAWHKLEVGVTTGNPTGSLQVYLDGTLVSGLNLSGKDYGTDTLDSYGLGANVASTSTVYFDDVAVDVVPTGDVSSAYVSDGLHVSGATTAATIEANGIDGNGNSINTAGGISAGGSFSAQGQTGLSSSCTSGQSMKNVEITGGIITGGVCGNAVSTLQDAYNNTSVQSGGSVSTPQFVRDAVGDANSTAPVTVTMPATNGGDLLVAIIGTGSSSPAPVVTSVTGGGTWHKAISADGGNSFTHEEIWYCYNCGSTTSVQVAVSKFSATTVNISEFSGVLKASDPLEIATSGVGADKASSTQTSPQITTVNNNDLIYAGMSICAGNATGASTPAGYHALTSVINSGNTCKQTYSDYNNGVAPGTYSATWTISGGSSIAGTGIVAFKPDNSGGGTVASILLTDAKDYIITAPDTSTDPNIIFNLQCRVGCSTSQGRWAIQSNGVDALSVLYDPGTAITNVRLNSGVYLKLAADAVGAPSAESALTHDFSCTSSEQVHDIIIIDSTGKAARTGGGVTGAATGVVVAKPSSTVCTVAFSGIVQVTAVGTVTIGAQVQTSGTAGAAQISVVSPSNPNSIGIAISGKDGNGLVWILMH